MRFTIDDTELSVSCHSDGIPLIDMSIHKVRSVTQEFIEYDGSKWTALTVRYGFDEDKLKEAKIVLFQAGDEHVEIQTLEKPKSGESE